MTVKELIEELKTLNPDNRIIVCAKDCETPEISALDFYHKGEISSVTFHCMDDFTKGAYVIEADKTFLESVRKGGEG